MSPNAYWTATDEAIILHLLNVDGGATCRSIAKSVGCTTRNADYRLGRMVADGMVARTRSDPKQRGRMPHVYALTDAGKMRARLCVPVSSPKDPVSS